MTGGRRPGILMIVLLLAVLAPAAAGEGPAPTATLDDGRVGKIYFESRTPAGYFALARRDPDPKAVVFGTLRLPRDASGRAPAW